MTEHGQPADPVAPAEPVESVAPAEPVDPAEPAEPVAPGAPVAPVVPALPEPVRARVIALAADVLGRMPAEERPTALAPFARFTPTKRARLAAAPLAAALETDEDFRAQAAAEVRTALPDVATAVEEGRPIPAAPPEDVAAAAYLLRPPGWVAYVEQAAADLAQHADAAGNAARDRAVVVLRQERDDARAAAKVEAERLRTDIAALRSDNDDLRRQLREARDRARQADSSLQQAVASMAAERAAAAVAVATSEAESRRLRRRLGDAEAAVEVGRRVAREGRSVDDARLRILLDTVIDATAGLRRELALPPSTERPADGFAAAVAAEAVRAGDAMAVLPTRGLADDDPQLLDLLLGVPGVHLVVDGYNVTKTGYGSLPLETQRARLLAGLAAIAAQSSAEVTCVFDGIDRPTPLAVAAPRGVRLLFSGTGDSADDLIRRLVGAEPSGRPIVVVSSDREVADGVRRRGARPLAATALLRRLERGLFAG